MNFDIFGQLEFIINDIYSNFNKKYFNLNMIKSLTLYSYF